MEEIWKDVVGYEDYFKVSSFGNIMSKRTGTVLKQSTTPKGYKTLSVRVNGNVVNFRAHRLVASAFLQPPPEEFVRDSELWPYKRVPVNHKDCNKKNNRVENLEWTSPKINSEHSIINGRVPPKLKGIESPLGKLTKEDVEYIKSSYIPRSRLKGTRALAIELGIHHTQVSRILRGVSYYD